MVKNVKIDDETHRLLSMKAAALPAQKGDLCSILIRAALIRMDDKTLLDLLKEYVPDDPRPT